MQLAMSCVEDTTNIEDDTHQLDVTFNFLLIVMQNVILLREQSKNVCQI